MNIIYMLSYTALGTVFALPLISSTFSLFQLSHILPPILSPPSLPSHRRTLQFYESFLHFRLLQRRLLRYPRHPRISTTPSPRRRLRLPIRPRRIRRTSLSSSCISSLRWTHRQALRHRRNSLPLWWRLMITLHRTRRAILPHSHLCLCLWLRLRSLIIVTRRCITLRWRRRLIRKHPLLTLTITHPPLHRTR